VAEERGDRGAAGDQGKMICVYRVAWHSPYTEPPAGWPRVLAESLVPDWHSSDKRYPDDLEQLSRSRWGYTIYTSLYDDNGPDARKSWSRERKAKARKQRLEKRLEKQCPMFWQQMYQEELSKRPLYYAARDPNFDISAEAWAAKHGIEGFESDPGAPYREAARRLKGA